MGLIEDRKISICRVIYEFYPIIGGSITHTLELSTMIDPYLKNQIIFAPDYGQKYYEFDKDHPVEIHRIRNYFIPKVNRISTSQVSFFIFFLNLFLKLWKVERPDILHFHGIWSLSYGCIIGRLLGIPVVGMLHGSIGAYSKRCDLYETLLANVFNPDHVFVLDDGSNAPDKFKNIWNDKVTIVYHGIDTSYLKPYEKNTDLAKKHGFNNMDFIVLSTSSLEPVKNIDLLILCFQRFITKYNIKNANLLIAGEGSLKESLMQFVKNLNLENNVIFLGGITKNMVKEYLSISDLFVASSLYSNMNRATLEAMAYKKPVIVFDNGSIDKLIKHMENGILVRSGDINTFAEYMQLLYSNSELRTRLGINARETIRKERSWERRIKQELEVYNLLCSQ